LIQKLQKLHPKNEFVVYAKDDVDKACLKASANAVVKTLSGKLFFDFEQIFLPIAAKRDKVDLLHCTGNTAPYFSPAPIVQTLHDVIFMDAISGKDTLYQQYGNLYRRKIVPLVTPRSEAVITVSNYEKERILKRIKLDEKKIRVIYNGIDEKRFKIIDDLKTIVNTKVKYKLPGRFILFIGNTAARKNALRVIESYTLYVSRTQNPLPLVTPGLPDEFIDERLAELKQSDKKRFFITPGYIDDGDLPTLYSLSTVFLYPSLSEGFGMPLVEAMACGSPVITSGTSCLPEIAGDAALLVDPTNVESIAGAIEKLLSDETLRKRKIEDGLRNAKRFSWNRTAEEVFEVYEKVLFNRRAVGQARVAYGFQ
jgi:glycosyltransferase involved in cell wall biosynthesis